MKKNWAIAVLALVIVYLVTRAFVTVFLETRAEAAGVEFTVDNAGFEALRAVIVDVTGRSYKLGDLPVGSSKTVTLHATGDSHIELRFSNGRHLTVDCYFEPAYTGRIKATITSQAVIAVEDKTKAAPY